MDLGLTRLTIGYLNSSTGFLVSIIAGNGINYGIMYMARYLEARRDQGASVEDAIQIAHRDSWVPTLASAATAMLAYGSLIFTDFRGFKHFGVIGAYGMIICWLTAYLFSPALLAASERVMPSFKAEQGKETRARGYYGVLFAKLAMSNPRAITAVGAVLSVISLAMAARYFSVDPMEYDMANIRNERKTTTAAGLLSHKVSRVVGQIGQDGLAIMTQRLDQVPMLEAELNKRRDAAPADKKPFDKVVSIYSLIPDRQPEKIKLIEEINDTVQRARKRGFISDKDWVDLQPHLPQGALRELTIESLPEQVARPFTEKDGTRGRIVYIVPATGFSVWDARYLMRWADSFRTTPLPSGEVVKGSGQAVIYADMIKTIGEDAPKAIIFASLGSILVIIVAFRGRVHALGVFVPWLVGVAALVAFLQYKGVKLNFLNFVALPIHHRHRRRVRPQPDAALPHRGRPQPLPRRRRDRGRRRPLLDDHHHRLPRPAGSINKGIVSFGSPPPSARSPASVAAVLMLPAFLAWRAHRREERGQVFEGEAREGHDDHAAANS